MGTDIHGRIERRYYFALDKWESVVDIRNANGGHRPYDTWCTLFGVRCTSDERGIFAGRGIPLDASQGVLDAWMEESEYSHSPTYATFGELTEYKEWAEGLYTVWALGKVLADQWSGIMRDYANKPLNPLGAKGVSQDNVRFVVWFDS